MNDLHQADHKSAGEANNSFASDRTELSWGRSWLFFHYCRKKQITLINNLSSFEYVATENNTRTQTEKRKQILPQVYSLSFGFGSALSFDDICQVEDRKIWQRQLHDGNPMTVSKALTQCIVL